jgi:hypothetical protein
MAALKVFTGYASRKIPGLVRHAHRQVGLAVATTSRKGVLEALKAAGIHGWTLYAISQYWLDGGDDPEPLAEPGRVFYRPLDAHQAPWVPWDEEYPPEHIPPWLREKPAAQ